jgi:hypothetical protein
LASLAGTVRLYREFLPRDDPLFLTDSQHDSQARAYYNRTTIYGESLQVLPFFFLTPISL